MSKKNFNLNILATVILLYLPAFAMAQTNGVVEASVSGQDLHAAIYLKDGGILEGQIIVSDETTITIQPSSGGEITIFRSYIEEIKVISGKKEQQDFSDADNRKTKKNEKSLLSKGVIVTSQVLGGCAIAAGIGGSLWRISRSRNPVGGNPLLELLIPPGIILGSSEVVHWIGNSLGDWDGSYAWTVVGALTPVVAGTIVVSTTNTTSPDGFSPVVFGAWVGYIFGSFFSPVGAVIGYHLSRSNEPAGISTENGRLQFCVPALTLQTTHPIKHHPETDYILRLVSVSF